LETAQRTKRTNLYYIILIFLSNKKPPFVYLELLEKRNETKKVVQSSTNFTFGE